MIKMKKNKRKLLRIKVVNSVGANFWVEDPKKIDYYMEMERRAKSGEPIRIKILRKVFKLE